MTRFYTCTRAIQGQSLHHGAWHSCTSTTIYFALVVHVWRALPDLSCGLRADECLVVLTRDTGSRVQFSRGSSGAGAQLGKRHEGNKNASTLVTIQSRAGQSVTRVDVGHDRGAL